jgi:hypothetical protein
MNKKNIAVLLLLFFAVQWAQPVLAQQPQGSYWDENWTEKVKNSKHRENKTKAILLVESVDTSKSCSSSDLNTYEKYYCLADGGGYSKVSSVFDYFLLEILFICGFGIVTIGIGPALFAGLVILPSSNYVANILDQKLPISGQLSVQERLLMKNSELLHQFLKNGDHASKDYSRLMWMIKKAFDGGSSFRYGEGVQIKYVVDSKVHALYMNTSELQKTLLDLSSLPPYKYKAYLSAIDKYGAGLFANQQTDPVIAAQIKTARKNIFSSVHYNSDSPPSYFSQRAKRMAHYTRWGIVGLLGGSMWALAYYLHRQDVKANLRLEDTELAHMVKNDLPALDQFLDEFPIVAALLARDYDEIPEGVKKINLLQAQLNQM